jgi:hypothetical protein
MVLLLLRLARLHRDNLRRLEKKAEAFVGKMFVWIEVMCVRYSASTNLIGGNFGMWIKKV